MSLERCSFLFVFVCDICKKFHQVYTRLVIRLGTLITISHDLTKGQWVWLVWTWFI